MFCQIQKNGGDWKRQYLMRPGNIQIEEVDEATDWLGVENYRKRLHNAGLSPAMAKVLALEQGETDKLCEYAPRQLLDLVFQVFGDKEVLDAYDEAKRHQRDTETELKRFESELEASRTNLEGLRLRVANYHQWEDLHKERRNLLEEVLPSLEYHEAREKAASASRVLRDARKPMAQADTQLTEKRNALAAQAKALTDAQQQETLLEQEATVLGSRLTQVNGKLKPLDSLLEQKERLQKLAADSGADIAEVAAQLDQKGSRTGRASARRATRWPAASSPKNRPSPRLQGKSAMPEPDAVRGMRRALRDEGIAHAMLSDIVEVTDPKWQGAVEGVLGGYASVVLLERAKDAAAAYRLAEKERYRHFIVPDLHHGAGGKGRQPAVGGAFFGRRAAMADRPAGAHRAGRLGRRRASSCTRTPSGSRRTPITANGAAGARCSSKCRATASARPAAPSAWKRCRKSLPALEAQEDALTLAISKAGLWKLARSRRVIAGVDAAKELAARQAEFDEALRGTLAAEGRTPGSGRTPGRAAGIDQSCHGHAHPRRHHMAERAHGPVGSRSRPAARPQAPDRAARRPCARLARTAPRVAPPAARLAPSGAPCLAGGRAPERAPGRPARRVAGGIASRATTGNSTPP